MKFVSLAALGLVACASQRPVQDTPIYRAQFLQDRTLSTEDSLLVLGETAKYGSRAKASRHSSQEAWRSLSSTKIGWSIPFYQAMNNPGKFNTALKNFNDAWLLDSLNAHAYWGTSIILSDRDKNYTYAAELMEKATRVDTSSANLWMDYGLANAKAMKFGDDTGNVDKYRDEAIRAFLKTAASKDHPELKERAEAYLRYLREN